MGPACAYARARGRANSSIQAMADHRIAGLREREGHQVTWSRRRVLTLAPATPCGLETAPLTCTLLFSHQTPWGPREYRDPAARRAVRKVPDIPSEGPRGSGGRPARVVQADLPLRRHRRRHRRQRADHDGLQQLSGAHAPPGRARRRQGGARSLRLGVHGDLAELERRLQKAPATVGKMIIVDGVYSMDGDIADVPALLKISQRHGAVLAVDDAHAVGVLGPKGDGTAAHFGLADEVDLIVGTFSKSLASIGGFLVGPDAVITYLRYNARPLLFTAALPPSNTAGVLAALRVMQREPERRERLWHNAHRIQDGLRALGFDIGPTETPIIPFLIGDFERTLLFWRKLFDAGVFTNPVVPPALPPSRCRLRTSVMATHTDDQIDYALETFGRLGKELGVI